MSPKQDSRLRIAAIDFLNPAPLMWDFEHPPRAAQLAERYAIQRMTPAECARQLAEGGADIGLVPTASLATIPGLRIVPGCTIASKGRVRSLLLVRRARQPLAALRAVAADTASRTTVTYARLLFRMWKNATVSFVPMAANLDAMLERADAAIVIGDPALLALEERENRLERSSEELVYHDLAYEWRLLTGLPFVSAVWGVAPGSAFDERIAGDFIYSRDHGLAHREALAAEWAPRLPIPEATLRDYLTTNIHYVLDEECVEGMHAFFRMACEAGALPEYTLPIADLAVR